MQYVFNELEGLPIAFRNLAINRICEFNPLLRDVTMLLSPTFIGALSYVAFISHLNGPLPKLSSNIYKKKRWGIT